MIQTFILIRIVLLGIPAGLLVSKYAKEELKPGKKWFKMIMAISGFIFMLAFASLRKA